jgi:hypothetical protein
MIKITIELPADAAERLVTLLKSDTPEGKQAREALKVETITFVQTERPSQCDCFSVGVNNCLEHGGKR